MSLFLPVPLYLPLSLSLFVHSSTLVYFKHNRLHAMPDQWTQCTSLQPHSDKTITLHYTMLLCDTLQSEPGVLVKSYLPEISYIKGKTIVVATSCFTFFNQTNVLAYAFIMTLMKA